MNSNRSLIIVGFSGFGKEVFWLASRLGIHIAGFLDDDLAVQSSEFHGVPVLGFVNDWVKYPEHQFVIAVGNPRIRKKIKESMCSQEEPSFAILIDPAAQISSEYVSVGAGSIVCAGVVATVDIEIGEHVIVNLNSTIGHECVIGNYVTIAPMVAISGRVNISSKAEVGTGASLRQGLAIATGAMVGMGSVLTKDVVENTLVFGNPAKVIKKILD